MTHLFKPRNWFDRIFAIGVVGKGLNGLSELVGGVLLLLLRPAGIHRLVVAFTQSEPSEDPGDFVATHLLHTANGLTGSTVVFGAIYLLTHGLVKVALVTAVLLDKLWAYPWMIAVLSLFIVYQLYRITIHPSLGLVALTIFDLTIVGLTSREYVLQRRRVRSAVLEPTR